MSLTLQQIFVANPTSIIADTDLFYLVQSPYSPGSDAAIIGSDLKSHFLQPSNNLSDVANPVLARNNLGLSAIAIASAPLSPTLGGTGINNGTSTIVIGGNFSMFGAFTFEGTLTGNTTVTFPTTGTLATISQLPTGAPLTKVDDANVTLTLGGTPGTALLQSVSLTLGWTGQLSLARGGTNASLVASNGGIFYSTASAGAILAGTATARQMLQSGASTAPAWSTTIWPATSTINRILYSSAANVIDEIVTGNDGFLITSGTGVPSISNTVPAFTTSSITFSPTTGGIVGTTTNNNADAGKVGEFVSSVIASASAVNLTTGVTANVTSISLTAGDWDVQGEGSVTGVATSVVQAISFGITTTSATFPTQGVSTAVFLSGSVSFTVGASNLPIYSLSPCRISLSATTSVFLVANFVFTTAQARAYGKITARRVR